MPTVSGIGSPFQSYEIAEKRINAYSAKRHVVACHRPGADITYMKVGHNNILERLRIDPGQRTLGQLLQDREAAAHEIGRLRAEIDRLGAEGTMRASNRGIKPLSAMSIVKTSEPPFRAGTLLRISDVCEWLGISRSTIYKLLSDGTFPEPVRLGPRTVRWRIDAIEVWRDARTANPHPRS